MQCGFVCDDNRPEPDVLWLRPGRYRESHATAADVLLLIEVSDSSVGYDTGIKVEVYAEAGVSEYWVVDVGSRQVRVYSNPDGKLFRSVRVVEVTGSLSPGCLPSASLNLIDLFLVSD